VPAVRTGQRPVLARNDPLDVFGEQRQQALLVAADMKDSEIAFLRGEIYRRDVDPPMRAIIAYDRYSARC
jgi:hypothetical protein